MVLLDIYVRKNNITAPCLSINPSHQVCDPRVCAVGKDAWYETLPLAAHRSDSGSAGQTHAPSHPILS